ncbi:TPA: glutamine-hydrolyzing GMP synthase, partial [Candidatus Sumerlaeota bacterium]|nr:glutamine-hydrolyzing GMP synthase [Candidatus Sumerlaeota bacterium]
MIVVLDFGSQYSQLIARKIRQLNVYTEIVPFNTTLAQIKKMKPQGIILSGGPASVYAENAPQLDKRVLELGVPVLGICYGLQSIAHKLGGKVEHSEKREYGHADVMCDSKDPFWNGLGAKQKVWMSHGDKVVKLPKDFKALGKTDTCPFAVVRHAKLPIYGVQFHPEVHHTVKGNDILRNFAVDVCGCATDWRMHDFVEKTIADLREHVGDRRVVCAVSGGVDSTVMAVLLHRAIGDQLVPVFVDNGVLRKDEVQDVIERFNGLGIKIKLAKSGSRFLKQLKGVSDPEKKRKIIGRTFIEVFFDYLKPTDFLAQGTLYPDVI